MLSLEEVMINTIYSAILQYMPTELNNYKDLVQIKFKFTHLSDNTYSSSVRLEI